MRKTRRGKNTDDGLNQMDVSHFAGLFLGWGIVSALILLVAHIPKRAWTGLVRCARRNPEAKDASEVGETHQINYDNEASMLREVLRQLSEQHELLRSAVDNKVEVGKIEVRKADQGDADEPSPLHSEGRRRRKKSSLAPTHTIENGSPSKPATTPVPVPEPSQEITSSSSF